ncbi:MAG TPA: transglutaminase family protein [Terriglobia bacterium]
MNRYHLVHVTQFYYDGAVSESYNEVRLRPMHDELQSCLSFRLRTQPGSQITSYRDAFGNWVHSFNVLPEHRQLSIEAESVVLAHYAGSLPEDGMTLAALDDRRQNLFEDYFDFVVATGYVPRLPGLDELQQMAEQASGGTVLGFARAASDLIHQRFQYVKGATHVHSSITDSIQIGAGVCQDFAHLLLGLVRGRGLPGRYVSGYLTPSGTAEASSSVEEVIGGQASHAWAEVYAPGSGWMGLDPTLGEPVGARHVRVAYGRDYGDVAPVRGVYKGHAGQSLSVDVRVRPALDDEGHEQIRESSAIPVPAPMVERAQQPVQQQQQ